MEVICKLSYSPQVDRIFGGDMVRAFQRTPVRVLLMSVHRAQALQPLMCALADAYSQSSAEQGRPPFPQVIAVIQQDGIPVRIDGVAQTVGVRTAFGMGLLPMLSKEYLELAHVVTVPHTPVVLDGSAVDAGVFAKRLFTIVRCGHRQGMVFSRASGSCLTRRNVTTDGCIVDLYHLSALDPRESDEHVAKAHDLAYALRLVRLRSGTRAEILAQALTTACSAYLDGSPAVRRSQALALQIAASLADASDTYGVDEVLGWLPGVIAETST